MSKNKIVLSLFTAIFIGLVGLYFYAKATIDPSEVKVLITEKLEKSLPGASVSLGELKIKYGPSISIKVKGVDILLKKEVMKKRDLLQIDRANIRLPLISLLTGGGNLEVNLEGTELFLHRGKGIKGNWKEAFDKAYESKEPLQKNAPAKSTQNILLPAFLINSTVALRLRDFKVFYDVDEKVGLWRAEKLIVKNLGINSNAAFEVQSTFKRRSGDKEKFSFDLVLIGSLEFSRYLKTGQLNINSNIKLQEIKLVEENIILPLVRGDTNLTLEKDGRLSGGLRGVFKESNLNVDFFVNKDKGEVKFKEASVRVSDLNGLISDLSWGALSLNQAQVGVKGRLEVKNQKLIPFVTFDASNILLKKDNLNFSFNGKGSFEGRSLRAKMNTASLGGTTDLEMEADFDLNSSTSFEERVAFYRINAKGTKNIFSKELLAFLNKGEEKKAPGTVEEVKHFFLLPKGIINFSFEDATLDKITLSGGLSLKTDRNKVELKNGTLLTNEGKLTFLGSGNIYKSDLKWDLRLNADKWKLENLNSFIKPQIGILSGEVGGKIKIHSLNRPLNIQRMEVDISSEKGELSFWDPSFLSKTLSDSIKRSSFLKIKTDSNSKLKKSYKDLSLKAEFTPELYDIENMIFTDEESKQVIVKGKIDPEGKERKRVKVWIKGDVNFQKSLSKKTRLKSFPLGFWSKGFVIEEDPLYSLGVLAKKLRFKKDIKTIRKTIKKVESEIKKEENEKS